MVLGNPPLYLRALSGARAPGAPRISPLEHFNAQIATFAATLLQDLLAGRALAPAVFSMIWMLLLQALCTSALIVPDSFWIEGVTPGRRSLVGGEAVIYEGEHGTGPVVVRELRPSENRDWRSAEGKKTLKKLIQEVVIHCQLRHENIICFIGLCWFNPNDLPGIILSRATGGRASPHLKHNPHRFLHIIYGVACGVAYLHSRMPAIVHGDLHPDNFIVDECGIVKICDFGCARIICPWSFGAIGAPGRLRFLAPELDPTSKSFISTLSGDVYALALSIYALGTSREPFEGLHEWAVAEASRNGERPGPAQPASIGGLDDASSQELWSILMDMWHPNPSSRPSALTAQTRIGTLL